MTLREFAIEQERILSGTPTEFRVWIQHQAYKQARAGDREDVLRHQRSLAEDLQPVIIEYAARILAGS